MGVVVMMIMPDGYDVDDDDDDYDGDDLGGDEVV